LDFVRGRILAIPWGDTSPSTYGLNYRSACEYGFIGLHYMTA